CSTGIMGGLKARAAPMVTTETRGTATSTPGVWASKAPEEASRRNTDKMKLEHGRRRRVSTDPSRAGELKMALLIGQYILERPNFEIPQCNDCVACGPVESRGLEGDRERA